MSGGRIDLPISQEFSQAAADMFTAWNSFSLLAEEVSRATRDVPHAEALAAINDLRAALVALDGQIAWIESRVRGDR